jgi:Domain of unknown function (DUF4082)/Bacterial Ig domain
MKSDKPYTLGQLVLKVIFWIMLVIQFGNTAIASCATPANPIEAENCKIGNPASEWDVSGAGDPSIQGFATNISVNRGQIVSFKVDTTASNFRLDIYRLGFYDGQGARKIATINSTATLPQIQPECLRVLATGLVDCGNWSVSATWRVPANVTSGIYIAKVVRPDTGGASHIVFIVRNDRSTSKMLFKTSDTTWQAYNDYGGNSLYVGSPAGRAYKVSYNRPFNTRGNQFSRAWLFGAEYPMVRWLEANGYDLSYTSSIDVTRRNPVELKQHRILLSVGHDEYWSAAERNNVESARNAGVNLAFFSGNEIFWKIRWENSLDGSNSSYRTLVSYKETAAGAKIDPKLNIWTGTWRDPRFSPPGDGGRPENALTGTLFTVNCCQDAVNIIVPERHGKLRFWRNTSIAALAPGQVANLPRGILGYEWDEALDNGFMPPGLIKLSSTTINVGPGLYLIDYGTSFSTLPAIATHSLTMYRHPSGALIFGAGTIRWSWALDNHHDIDFSFPIASAIMPDQRIKQATVNLFADMDAQPASLKLGLRPALKSTDVTAPTSIITSPVAGSTVGQGANVNVTGTAIDNVGGGTVGGVEFSTDGGSTWHPATGAGNWSYTWTPTALGFANIRSRAIDDSLNSEFANSGVTLTVTPRTCPCTIWPASTLPAIASAADSAAVELGVKFKSDRPGNIRGVRFYKGANNSGNHVGKLYNTSGKLLASATFTNETATGWQQVNFAVPVAISANTVYVASYFAPNGRYAITSNYFETKSFDSTPLHALQNGISGGNGVFFYGPSGGFPNQTFNTTNYWVDVVFSKSP